MGTGPGEAGEVTCVNASDPPRGRASEAVGSCWVRAGPCPRRGTALHCGALRLRGWGGEKGEVFCRFLTGVLGQKGPAVAMVIASPCWFPCPRAGYGVRVVVTASVCWASAVRPFPAPSPSQVVGCLWGSHQVELAP